MAKTLSKRAIDWFSAGVCEAIRQAIEYNDGREVFFIGRMAWDDKQKHGRVTEAEAHAFGAESCVPALKRLCRPGDVIIHNHPSGELAPSEADVNIASSLADLDVASFIIDNTCENVHVLVKPHPPKKIIPLTIPEIDEFFKPGGVLAKHLPRTFEHRPEQMEMARAITQSFNDNKIALIEAGTGVGKSFAYLIPAILWAVQNGERVVISTNTINLQEQLIHKDIPLLKEVMELEFDAVLLKGRSNYLGLRKTKFAQQEKGLFFSDDPADNEFREIFEWVEKTPDGSLASLSFRPREEVWERVVSEAENCLRLKCPTYDKCFYFRARRAAARAQVIVVNHHLLMSDLSIRAVINNYSDACVLPPFTRLVLDEAHNLEDVATSYFTIEFSRIGLEKTLGRFMPRRKPEKGLLHFVASRVFKHRASIAPEKFEEAMRLIKEELPYDRSELSDTSAMFLETIAHQIPEIFAEHEFAPGRTYQLRITPDVANSDFYRDVVRDAVEQMSGSIFNFVSKAEKFLTFLKTVPYEEDEALRDSLMEFRGQLDKLLGQGERLKGFIEREKGWCRWFEYFIPRQAGRDPIVKFCAAPINIGAKLRETLFRPMKTVAMTSATLTVDRSFAFVRSRVGLEVEGEGRAPSASPGSAGLAQGDRLPFVLTPEKLLTLMLESPFRYQDQALVAAPTDLPTPEQAEFSERLPGIVAQAVEKSRGRALILFTAYTLLDRTFSRAAPAIENLGYTCLRQGDGSPRHLLLEQFKTDITSVLFATASFWEGIDVPGEALQCVVITRLPFRVPTEPIWQARVEEMERQGRDAFSELTVPQAVIKFKQAFGRLIRRSDDRGIVLILDTRVTSKRYGQIFLRSLPTKTILKAPLDEVLARMGEFAQIPAVNQ